ncbi:MAG TPA: alpha/beta fold hydrolase [Actinomycetota bacterium]|nr:alpha/beta fold hydrolase [Actinomycetota bacterium]
MKTQKLSTTGGPISLAVDGDGATTIVLGHGAGAPLDSDYMAFFATELAQRGYRVVRFNFPYMEAGRRAPDKQPVLIQTFRAVVEETSADADLLIVGGKSMGGRIASHAVAEGMTSDGVVFLGYPLHPPGRPERIRDAHLRDIKIPMLFVEGTRDPFCPLDTLESVRGDLPAPTEVLVIEDGDHSLKVRKSSGRDTRAAWTEAVDGIGKWVSRL